MKQKQGTTAGNSSVWLFDGCGDFTTQMKRTLEVSYHLRCFEEIELLLESLDRVEPSVIIVCIERDSYSITKKVRNSFANPIIAVSPIRDAKLVKHCLDAGADDCLVEPVDPDILCAKIQAFLKTTRMRVPDLIFDSFAQTVSDPSGRRLKLTRKEFKILEIIAKAGDAGVTPKEVRLQIWGDFKVVSKSLDVHLFNIRGKLEPLGRFIKFREGRYWLLKEDDL